MEEKKEARKLGGKTGKCTNKYTKRSRIKHFELVSKWQTPDEVLTWERGAE